MRTLAIPSLMLCAGLAVGLMLAWLPGCDGSVSGLPDGNADADGADQFDGGDQLDGGDSTDGDAAGADGDGQTNDGDSGPIDLPPNTWVLIGRGDVGPRTSAAMAYLEASGEYVLAGGSMPISATPRPYDVQSLKLAEMVWKNRYPPGVDWGPEVGDSSAPEFGTEHFVFEDAQGNPRPNWSAYPSIHCYHQVAHQPATGQLLFYLYNRTFSYDLDGRTWSLHAPAADPAGGVDAPRLLWGAMAADPTDEEVLLVGGGNVLDADGRPGTWIYQPTADAWRQVAGPDPGPRALPGLATDPDRGQALLFGGDALDHLLADTWAFDFSSETWSQLAPPVSPAPRAGHQLLFLPTSHQLVLLGGFGYSSTTDYVSSHYESLPWEIWRFDWDSPGWDLIKRFGPEEEQPSVGAMRNVTWAAAAGVGDVVVVHVKHGYPAEMDQSETWAIRIDPSVTDPAGTAAHGVGPGTQTFRTGPYDPAWYETGWPDPDPVAHAALIAATPVNTWTEVPVPNRPEHNHDWGTAAYDPARNQLFRWSGGHSAHCGTDVLELDLTANRYHMHYPPEFPLEFEYTNDQVPGQWSFAGRPFMTGHTYKTYAFSAAMDKLVVWKNPVIYFYDPDLHDFEPERGLTDGGGNMYTTVLCPTPDGLAAWTPDGLWALDPVSRGFEPLPISGSSPPAMSPDRNSLVYDAARDRLLLFASTGDDLGQVWAYDRVTGELTALSPTGQDALRTAGPGFWREAVLAQSADAVVMGAAYDSGDGLMRTPVLHLAENRWYAYAFGGQAAQDEAYGVSLGLVIDAAENIWAINSRSHMFLLKLDPATADKLGL